MVYPRKEFECKKAILEVLKDHTTPDTGIGFNSLFDKLTKKIGSRTTFQNYLWELLGEGYVKQEKDPKDKRKTLLYRTEASKFEEMFLDFIEEFRNRIVHKKMKPVKLDIIPDTIYIKSIKKVANCIALSHKTLLSMLSETVYKQDPYIRSIEIDEIIHLQFK